MRRPSPCLTFPLPVSLMRFRTRRRSCRLAVSVMAAAATISAAAAVSAAAPAEPAAPAPEASETSLAKDDLPLELEAQPGYLRAQSRIHFTEDGVPTFATEDFQLNLRVLASPSLGVMAYRVLETPVAVTDSGEKIHILSFSPNNLNSSRISQNEKWKDHFYITLRGTPPTVHAKTLERVTARIELQMGRDADESHEFGPIEDLVDTTIEIPGVEGCTLSVKKQRSRYRVEYSGEAWKRVKHVAYVRNNGETGRNANLNNIRHRTQQGNVYSEFGSVVAQSNEGKIVVQFWKDVLSREARIELRDVPLQSDPEADG